MTALAHIYACQPHWNLIVSHRFRLSEIGEGESIIFDLYPSVPPKPRVAFSRLYMYARARMCEAIVNEGTRGYKNGYKLGSHCPVAILAKLMTSRAHAIGTAL